MTCEFRVGYWCYFYVWQVISSHYQLCADDDALLCPQRLYNRIPQDRGQYCFHLVHGKLLACNSLL